MKKANINTLNREAYERAQFLAYMLKEYANEYAETDSDTADIIAVCAGWLEKALSPATTNEGFWANIKNGLF